MTTLSTEQLRRRCENAEDFSYDDEEAELHKRGYSLRWGVEFHSPKLILINN